MSKQSNQIDSSNYISRDLSWLQFNYRVLDQSRHMDRNVFEKLKFIAITSSNLDEFFMIRVGSLYNYIDFKKERLDYCGLRETPFRLMLLGEVKEFFKEQQRLFMKKLLPSFSENGFNIVSVGDLTKEESKLAKQYFKKTIFPMLTPMVYDSYHTFPILMNNRLIFGVVTKVPGQERKKDRKKLSFIQLPHNLPRFFEIKREEEVLFLPIERIVKDNIQALFKNVDIVSADLFRVTRNGDFTLEESDDIEANFLEELKRKLKKRKTGRVVSIQVEEDHNPWLVSTLKKRWEIDEHNVFEVNRKSLIDFTCLWQIVKHDEFKEVLRATPEPIPPLNYPEEEGGDIMEALKQKDIILHHPYNDMETLLELIEKSAEDPEVLAIKITIYRLAKDSRITTALLKAAENGKHVSVLFEVKARFDEENNLKQAQLLEKAGCYVIYGVSSVKTHTKLLLIVKKSGKEVTRYVHMSSGNYNEDTAGLYTDIGILSTDSEYANDVSEFFNAITGHSNPEHYGNLITAPNSMRSSLIELIQVEKENAKQGLASGIVIKVNSFQDKELIDELYLASQAGVPIKLIIRGMCCIRPGRKGLSDNIEVCSIVGDYLEHSRIYYFHNNQTPKVYVGSADAMVRSFDRRIESLFLVKDPLLVQQVVNILSFNLNDNVNAYTMNEDGSYRVKDQDGASLFNVHEAFYDLDKESIMNVRLF